MGRRAIFLDRDGVLNVGVHGDYIRSVSQFEWLPRAREAVAALTQMGWPVIVVTNQSGIARGLYTMADVQAITARMMDDLEKAGGTITSVYVCPHRSEDGCCCRKPLPGLLIRAAADLDLDLSGSLMIGDSEIDMRAGRAAGCRVLAVASGLAPRESIAKWPTRPDGVYDDLLEAVEWIRAHETDCG
jgi:D-glycero-D-manno-heptose 1,7-bisphosphate phosphatase